MLPFAEGVVSDSWQKVYVELYKDSLFVWYKKKNDKSNKGNVTLKVSKLWTLSNRRLVFIRAIKLLQLVQQLKPRLILFFGRKREKGGASRRVLYHSC